MSRRPSRPSSSPSAAAPNAPRLENEEEVQVAETARDQALSEAAAARRAADDATAARDEATRADTDRLVTETRTEHRSELSTLRPEHRQELAGERERADTALSAVRDGHRREVDALQAAVAALRGSWTRPAALMAPRSSSCSRNTPASWPGWAAQGVGKPKR